MWAVGIIAYFLLTDVHPFNKNYQKYKHLSEKKQKITQKETIRKIKEFSK